ncbi:MAG: hypothetical protein ACXVPN_07100 [Bacteroidia bacterium]
MKNHVNFFLSVFVTLTLQSVTLKAQAPVFKAATVSKPTVLWDKIPMNSNGENTLNGVEFYSKATECNAQKVDFVKLINKNSYPVKISYQTEVNGPVQFVRVPSMGDIEGACGATDPNAEKLVLRFPQMSKEDFSKLKQYIISTVTVTELK